MSSSTFFEQEEVEADENEAVNEEKYEQVVEWLKSVYQGQEIPAFEINRPTIDYLYRLANKSISNTQQRQWVGEAQRQQAVVFNTRAQNNEYLLEQSGVDMQLMSVEGQQQVEALATLTSTLQLEEARLSHMELALNRLEREEFAQEVRGSEVAEETVRLEEETRNSLVQQAQLKHIAEELEQEHKAQRRDSDLKTQNIKYMEAKAKEYAGNSHKLKKKVTAAGFKSNLTHAALVKNSEQLERVREECRKVDTRLASFRDLPPDEALARVKIEQARQNLAVLESKVEQAVSGLM